MEFEQTFEKKLKAYKRKKAEYEMLEEAEIEDEIFRKETVQEIIEALSAKLEASPIYNVTDLLLTPVAEEISSYGDDKSEKLKKQVEKKFDAGKKKLDKALLDYLNQPEERLCDFMVKKQNELNRHGSEMYKPVLMTKQTYSKLISNQIANPSFESCVQLMFTYKSDMEEANKILRLVGKAFSDSEYHRTVKYFIENKEYSIDVLNETLMKLDLKVIGYK
ncbi:MAG: hypothetical protein K5681_01880 [Treponema sp.]|nr:hypothetical protein [Treponema sp.]